jgi:hypothetical protein
MRRNLFTPFKMTYLTEKKLMISQHFVKNYCGEIIKIRLQV